MVPEEQAPREMVQPVVVGIDASSASVEALRLAVEEARAHRTRVRAVHVWHVSEQEYLAGFAPGANAVEEYRVRANRLLTDSLAQVASRGVTVEPVLLEAESVANALVDESAHAMLLVVGSRGLHGIREAVIGSVSHACCQHAHCPVLVVPAVAVA